MKVHKESELIHNHPKEINLINATNASKLIAKVYSWIYFCFCLLYLPYRCVWTKGQMAIATTKWLFFLGFTRGYLQIVYISKYLVSIWDIFNFRFLRNKERIFAWSYFTQKRKLNRRINNWIVWDSVHQNKDFRNVEIKGICIGSYISW